MEWLRERDIAVYSGDCVERLPISDTVLQLPLHQIGIAAMGLALLDWPALTELLAACARYQRFAFLLTVAPLAIPGGHRLPRQPHSHLLNHQVRYGGLGVDGYRFGSR